MAPGVVLAWGANRFGQCLSGDDETTQVERRPRCVNLEVNRALSTSIPVVAVAAGEAHTLLLTAFGDVFACGRGREGQLGLELAGKCSRRLRPLEALRPWHIASIACGSKHSVALTRCGRAFEWGMLLPLVRNKEDDALVGKVSGCGKDFNEDLDARQRRIVAASWSEYLRRPTGGAGSAENTGEGGDEDDDEAVTTMMAEADCRRDVVSLPRPCAGLEELSSRSVECGWAHTVVVTKDGSVLAAGYGENGQLGKGARVPCPKFEKVLLPEEASGAAFDEQGRALISCGLNHTAVISASGHELYAWGLGVFGQLGLGPNVKGLLLPDKVPMPSGAPVSQVACGENHTIALTSDGELFAFGHRDSVSRQNFHMRYPEIKTELSRGTGDEATRIFAGGTGSFTVCAKQKKSDRFTNFQSFGYNQRYQLGRYIAELEQKKSGAVAFPPLLGASVRAFTAGSSHCVAVLDSPSCCVLPPTVGEPCFGNEPMLAALRGEPAHDVTVITGSGDVSENLGIHYCVLRARCPALATRVKKVRSLEAYNPWELDLRGHTRRCVNALVEFLYTDHCRMGPDVASELKGLATELKLERLLAGVLMASETESVSVGMRWVRGADRKWEQIAANDENDLASGSSYCRDLEALVVESNTGSPSPDFVEVAIKQNEGSETLTLFVARALLLAVEFFRALLEGGFSESTSMQAEAPKVELNADDAEALALCLRMLACGDFPGLMPEDPAAILAVLVEAHRLQLREIVAATEARLGHALATQQCSAAVVEATKHAAALFDMPRLASAAGGSDSKTDGKTPSECVVS